MTKKTKNQKKKKKNRKEKQQKDSRTSSGHHGNASHSDGARYAASHATSDTLPLLRDCRPHNPSLSLSHTHTHHPPVFLSAVTPTIVTPTTHQ